MTPARLAIVDDEPVFVEYLKTFLRSRGYPEIESFTSGQALLQALQSDEAPDVVLLDVLMPGMDGLDTLRAIKQVRPAVQVIMLSGRQTPNTIVEAVRLGAADYVVKPDDPEGLGELALEAAIRNALEKRALSSEVARLRSQIGEHGESSFLPWDLSPAMHHVVTMLDRVADSEVGVLIRGESGVGKEVLARELHRRSVRAGRPFVKVNCAALPAELLESELFGHERGAFTGATASRIGKFEHAHKGTLMLDEIGEMPLALQAKLLHVLQDAEFTRLGSNRPINVDVRIIAATNRDLEVMMRRGTFREDLYYRLQVIEIRVPPLRQRKEEIPQLIEYFLMKYSDRYGRAIRRPSDLLTNRLVAHAWPGNVRELENVMKRYVILQDEALVLAELNKAASYVDDARSADNAWANAAIESAAMTAPAMVAPPVVPSAPMAPPPVTFVMPPQLPAAAAAPPLAAPGPAGVLPMAAASPAAASAAVAELAPASLTVVAGAPQALPGKLTEIARDAAMTAERDAITRTLKHFRWNRRKAAAHLGVSYKTLLNKIKECGIASDDA